MTTQSPEAESLERLSEHDENIHGASEMRSKKFRFKSKPHPPRDQRDRSRSPAHSNRRHHHHHYHHHHRSKRCKTAPTTLLDDASAYDDSIHTLPPETAFRESLFDALGDDEGAAFWEGVYGQPIHQYPNTYRDEETGELEKMSEEEYAAFVRRKMWEKSWEGVEEERQERRKRRREEETNEQTQRKKRSESGRDHRHAIFGKDIEDSLRRGEERKRKKRWASLWTEYLNGWNDLQNLIAERKGSAHQDPSPTFLRNKIIWPVESRRRKDITREEVEKFMLNGPSAAQEESGDRDELILTNALKIERVRWHPDKIQQRYGSLGIDEGTTKAVTAVFQVLDDMWNAKKKKK